MGHLYDSFAEFWNALSPEEQDVSREEMTRLLVKHGKRELFHPILILNHLGDYLALNPLPVNESAFVAPGYLNYILDRICERMSNDEKMSCTREDVLSVWLSKALYISP